LTPFAVARAAGLDALADQFAVFRRDADARRFTEVRNHAFLQAVGQKM
jgi:hypothetical protein